MAVTVRADVEEEAFSPFFFFFFPPPLLLLLLLVSVVFIRTAANSRSFGDRFHVCYLQLPLYLVYTVNDSP